MDVGGAHQPLDVSAKDESGIKSANVCWTNPADNLADVEWGSFQGEACTAVYTIRSGEWAYHGTYGWSHIELHDQNGLYRTYKSNGTWEQAEGTGTHGFSAPDLTVTS